jgi:hypothetical protein
VVIFPALCLVGSLGTHPSTDKFEIPLTQSSVTGVVTVLARDRLIISSQGYRL